MADDRDTRDRVIQMETELKALSKQVSDMNDKLTSLHELMLQAKGAKWTLGVLGVSTGAVGAWLTTHFPTIFRG